MIAFPIGVLPNKIKMNSTIRSPLKFQTHLVTQAVSQNIIVVLGQGILKEHVTVQVIKRLSLSRKKSIIVVGSNVFDWNLNEFDNFKTVICKAQTPEIVEADFAQIWESNDILFINADRLCNLLENGFINGSDLCVVVFDECQNALLHRRFYSQIMEHFRLLDCDIRILGFAKHLKSFHLLQLEGILDAKVCDIDTLGGYDQPDLTQDFTPVNAGDVGKCQISQKLCGDGALQLLYWYLAMTRSCNNGEILNQVWPGDLGLDQVIRIIPKSETPSRAILDPGFIFSCNFIFKGNPEVIYGGFRATKELAKSAAALEACRFLVEHRALDQYLLPVVNDAYFHESRSIVETAVLDYVEKLVPDPFVRDSDLHNQFYLTILDVGSNDENFVFKVPFVAIATRSPVNVDCIPLIPLWISKAKLVDVKLISYSSNPVTITLDQLAVLKSSQPLLWNLIFQGIDKKFQQTITEEDRNLTYYVLPVCREGNTWSVDWKLMESQHVHITLYSFLSKLARLYDGVNDLENVDFASVFGIEERASIFTNTVLDTALLGILKKALAEIDISCFEYLYTDLKMDLNLTKEDRVSKDIKTPMEVFYGSKGFEIIHPVIFAIFGNRRRSLKQHRFNPKYFSDSFQNFLLDTCYLVPLPKSFLDQLHLLPTVVTVLDMHSTVDQFYMDFDLVQIPRNIIFPAFLAPAVNYGVDYQRLESLGDSVLKLATTAFFYQYYYKDERFITESRGHIISNANLYLVARRFGLEKYLITQKPTLNTFAPPFMTRTKHSTPCFVSVKTLADFMEALIGAYFEYDYNLCWCFMEYFGLVPSQVSVWKMISRHPSHKLHYSTDCSDFLPLQDSLGYHFKFPGLLSIALSLPDHGPLSYERLECLGDAVLEAMIMKYFYLKYPDAGPSELHDLKIHSVNAEIFNRISFSLGLHLYVRGNFAESCEPYFEYLEQLTSQDFPTLTELDGPKVLGDLFEAVVGAIFVDQCGDLDRTWQVVKRLLDPFLELYATFDNVTLSPITEFYHVMTSLGLDRHSMSLLEDFTSVLMDNGGSGTKCTIKINGQLLAVGLGNTKRLAKHNAYQIALNQVKPIFERP